MPIACVFLMYWRYLVLLTLLPPAAARRSTLSGGSQHGAQRQINMLTRGFGGAADVREALVPLGVEARPQAAVSIVGKRRWGPLWRGRRARPPKMMSPNARPRRMKTSELKRLLEAAGVSTAGVVEKEELERLFRAIEKEDVAKSNSVLDKPKKERKGVMTVALEYMMGCAYAVVDDFRLLVDTGSSASILSSAAGVSLGLGPTSPKTTLRSRKDPDIELPGFAVASPLQQLPPRVDGILGFDCLRSFQAAEFDWSMSVLRLHRQPQGWEATFSSFPFASIPISVRRVSGGELPFVLVAFGSRSVEGLIDTGSPVTMVTPELADRCQMTETQNRNDDIISTGVDGQPTRMVASKCAMITLGNEGQSKGDRVVHLDGIVYAGTCPMMTMVGWQGKEAALLGLDLLRSGVQAGEPSPTASGGPRAGRLVLDFVGQRLLVFS